MAKPPDEVPAVASELAPTAVHEARIPPTIPESAQTMPWPAAGEPVAAGAKPAAPRYALGSEIGRGGMGRVVDATDTFLGRTVAIKEALGCDRGLLERFEREMRITARLEHPSIVPVHDAGYRSDGTPYYVMRKVAGRPLDRVAFALPASDRLAVVPYVLAAANALAHAHGRGVVHRDIKPTNILVGKHGETIVIDWGLAKVIDEPDDESDSLVQLARTDAVRTQPGAIAGTPGFMSPEQLRAERVDQRSDVYALGATLYVLLSRKLPHQGGSNDDIVAAARKAPPPSLGAVTEGIPPELGAIVDKALAYDRDARYADAGAFAADLERFLTGRLVAAHRYSNRERFIRWARRHRLTVAISASAAIAITVISTLAIVNVVRERERADAALVQALQRNEEIELARALSLVAGNPTGAVAIVKPLARGNWRTARAIGMAARARGVAFGMPGPPFTRSLELSSAGNLAVAGGSDGAVRIYEPATRKVHAIARMTGDARAVWADVDRTVVAWAGSRIAIVDVATGTSREIATAADPVSLRADGRTVWWCDRDGKVWSMDLGATQPVQLALAERVDRVEPRTGAILLAGSEHLWFARAGVVKPVTTGYATELVSATDGRFGAIIGSRIIEVDATGAIAGESEQREPLSLTWKNGALYVGSTVGFGRRGEPPVPVRDGGVREVIAGPDDSLVTRTQFSAFTVFDAKHVLEVPRPSAIHDLAASPTSSFVLAGSDGVVLVWDLGALRPAQVPLDSEARRMFYGGNQMIALQDGGRASWIDLLTLDRVQLALEGDVATIAFAPGGKHVLVIDTRGSATLVTRDARAGTPFEPATTAAFVTDAQIVVADETGRVRLVDVATRAARELVAGGTPVQEVQARGGWAVIELADDRVVRVHLTDRAVTELAGGVEHWFELLDGGDVAVTDGHALRIWHPDGTLYDHGALPAPVTGVHRVGADHLFVNTGGDSGHLVELRGARGAASVIAPGTPLRWIRYPGELGVAVDYGHRVFVADPLTGTSWLVAALSEEPIGGAVLSTDMTRVATLFHDRILVWTQRVPQGAAQTRTLLDDITNAHIDAKPTAAVAGPAPTLRLAW